MGQPQSSESGPIAARQYRTERIVVYWNPRICIHSHTCVRGLPLVFQPNEKPWIKVDAATADEIAAVVAQCPSGALHVERLDGAPPQEPDGEATITPLPNGPLLVRGRARILNADGSVMREDSRMTLCRCGQSNNKPFCDGSHRAAGFQG